MKSKFGALLVLLALSSLVMMLGFQKYAPRRVAKAPVVDIPPIHVRPSEPIGAPRRAHPRPNPSDRPDESAEVTLFVARPIGQEMRLVAVHQAADSTTPIGALRALAAYTPRGETEPTLPRGTRVLGLTLGSSGVATADFSHEIVDNFPGGSHTEQVLLGSIVDTLTQFHSIKRVAITVDGKPVDSIGGHIELDEPLERDASLIAENPS